MLASTVAAWSILMPIGSFLAALLVLIPLPSHFRARNIPTLSIIAWLFVVNVVRGVNAIVWANDVIIRLVVWCDIVTRVVVGANVALPAACFCLCMNLERVASSRTISPSHDDRRRRMLIDILICVGIPIIYLALFYIVQGHRFDIVEGFGCQAEDYISIPDFFLVWFPPILFALGTFVFAGLAFTHFLRRRITFAKHLESTSVGLTPARYMRLMAMSIVQMFWSLLVIGLIVWFNYRDGLRPWTDWADVHSNWFRIGQFPRLLIPDETLRWTYFLWWTTPCTAYLFFFFFAFGSDAVARYRSAFARVHRVALSIGSWFASLRRRISSRKFSSQLPDPVSVNVRVSRRYDVSAPYVSKSAGTASDTDDAISSSDSHTEMSYAFLRVPSLYPSGVPSTSTHAHRVDIV